MSLDGFHIVCLEPGADNPKKHSPVPAPEPPEGFVDNTVKVFRLNPDGSKGEFLGTMPAYPEGWDDPQQFREKGFQKKKEEVKEMPKKDIDFEAIVARAQEVAAERGISLYKASGIVAQETGLHRTTVYNHARAMLQAPSPEPAAAANQEPIQGIQGSQEPAEPSVSQLENEVKETYEDLAKQEREQGFGPEDEEPIPYRVVGKYEALGKAIGALVDEKNLQYGEAFNRGGCILEILYPDGVRPDQYRDMLGVIRVIDKLFRVANGKQGSEDPWQDIAGYGLLGAGGRWHSL